MLITLPNANFSATGLGRVRRFINGMPVTNLLGLWLFDDGNEGDLLTSVADYSGLGNHATVMPNWTAPTRRSYGAEVTTNEGTAFDTGLPINPSGQKMTVFVAGLNNLPGDEASTFNQWSGSTANGGMASPSTSNSNEPALVLNYNGTDSTGRWQVFDAGADMTGTYTIAQDEYQPAYGEATVAAIDIDATTDTAKLHVLGAPTLTVSNSGIGTFYDGLTDQGNLAIGAWAHALSRSATSNIAQIYGVAAYAGTFTDAEAQEYMGFLRDIAVARGVVFP